MKTFNEKYHMERQGPVTVLPNGAIIVAVRFKELPGVSLFVNTTRKADFIIREHNKTVDG